jgi:hypothetical protein
MATEINDSQESISIEVITDNPALVKEEMSENPKKPNEIFEETKALIEAIKTKAQSEVQKAGEMARESYLQAVRNATQEVEKLNLFDHNLIDDARSQIETEVEKDWDNLVKKFTNLGERIQEAAKTAWDILIAPRSDDNDNNSQ